MHIHKTEAPGSVHLWRTVQVVVGFPKWLTGKESTCQCRRRGFDSWVRKIPWSRKWQPTIVFLPEKSHRQRSLVGYSPWGCRESDTTEQMSMQEVVFV